jgi:hypothetical protein
MDFKKLTVHHYSEDPTEERRITISPMNITVIAAAIDDIKIGPRTVRAISVLFVDGGSIELNVSHMDLEVLEEAVGSYCLG